MKRMNLKRSITAFTLAAVMAASVVPVVPASAKTVKVSDVNSYGDVPAITAPSIALKESLADGQTTQNWTFTYSNVPEDVKYVLPDTESYSYDWDYDDNGNQRYYLTKSETKYEENKSVNTSYKQLADGNYAKTNESETVYAADKIVRASYNFDSKGAYTSKSESIYEKDKTSYKYYNYTNGQFVEDTSYASSYDSNNSYMFEDSNKQTMGTYIYDMGVMVFDAGDRTKPDGGTMSKDSAGKYVINNNYVGGFTHTDLEKYPNAKFEFNVNAGNLTPGNKEVVAYFVNTPAYDKAHAQAESVDQKAYCEAYISKMTEYNAARKAWNDAGATGVAPDWDDYAPDRSDYNTAEAVSKSDYYVYSAPVAITVDSEASINTIVTSTSVKFSFSSTGGASGYEVYRRVGKKYVKIATVSSATYTDSGLLSKTTYTYKVRPYYVNQTSNKVVYGKYRVIDATTKGSALNLKATVTSKNKIKLTWKKVSGATGYEIYRSNTASNPSTKSKGIYNGFDTFKKVKTLKKSKKTWTDKSVKANETYSYIVRAIMTKNKKTKGDSNLIIEGSDGASLRFGGITINESYTDAKGNKTITWNKVYGAAGYKVEEYTYDMTKKSWDWTLVTNLGKNATSYKFPAKKYTYFVDTDAQAKNDYKFTNTSTYRITPFKSATVLGRPTDNITTTYREGLVQKVTAKKEANGIRVSWTPVNGAVYYRVYRTLSSARVNNKDIGGYDNDNDNDNFDGVPVTEYVNAAAPVEVDVAAWNAAVDASVKAYKDLYAQQEKAFEDARKAGTATYSDEDKYITVKQSDYLDKSDKLKATDAAGNPKKYYYQNYSYERSIFDANTTSILDYFGEDIYSSVNSGYKPRGNTEKSTLGADGKVNVEFEYSVGRPVIEEDDAIKLGEDGRPQAGVTYDYYVVACVDTAKAATDYRYTDYGYSYNSKDELVPKEVSYTETDPTTNAKTTKYAPISDASILTYQTTVSAYNMSVVGPQPDNKAYATAVTYVTTSNFKGERTSTKGVKTYGTATFTSKVAAKKPTLKSVKATKGKVTITIKKKVAGADYYKVYRSTKKKGKYTSVGVTSSAKTTKLVDKSAVKGKTYYYKVVSVVKNEANGEVESAASAIKKVKAK